MNNKPGSTYQPSNKIGSKIPWIAIALALVLSLISGALIAAIAYWLRNNSFWTIIFKIGLASTCYLISSEIIKKVKSRNKKFSYLIIFGVSIISWYSFWAFTLSCFGESSYFQEILRPVNVLIFFSNVQHYGSGGDLTTISDTLAFFISLIAFASDREKYFCESCENYYLSRGVFINNSSGFLDEFKSAPKGHYHFLENFEFKWQEAYELQESDDDKKISTCVSVTQFYCEKCKKDSLVDIVLLTEEKKRKEDSKKKEDKDDEENFDTYKTEQNLEIGIYVDERTNSILNEKISVQMELMAGEMAKKSEKK